MLPRWEETQKRKNAKLLLASGNLVSQTAGRMKKYIGTHLEPDEHHALGLLAAAQGVSKSAFLRSLLQQAIRTAKKTRGKEAA